MIRLEMKKKQYDINIEAAKIEKTVERENLVSRTVEYKYSLKMFCTVRNFGKGIYNAEFTLKEANDDQGSY